MAISPLKTVSDTKFWTYLASAHIMWLETIKFFGSSCQSIKNEFMLIDELHNDVCKKFSQFLVEHFKDLTLVKKCSYLLDAWKLLNNIECQVLNLFGNTYLVINVSHLEEFLNLALTMREDSELMFSFHSSALEKLRTVSFPDIQCQPDSHQEIIPILVSPYVTQSGTEFGVNIPSANSSFPPAEIDNNIINEIVIGESICEEETKGNFTLSYKE